jgi:hypothetical protein
MTGDEMLGPDVAQQRALGRLATVERRLLRYAVRAPRMEAATGRRIGEIGRRTRDPDEAAERAAERRERVE